MMGFCDAIDLVLEELAKAEDLHPAWPDDPVHAAAIVAEESGEAVKAALDLHYHGGPIAALEVELAHTAATAIRALMGLQKRSGSAKQLTLGRSKEKRGRQTISGGGRS